jgi:hypothetical protein
MVSLPASLKEGAHSGLNIKQDGVVQCGDDGMRPIFAMHFNRIAFDIV